MKNKYTYKGRNIEKLKGVYNNGFIVIGDKGKEVIINHKGKTHKIWKNHLDYIERTKHLNIIDETTNTQKKGN